MIEDLIKICPNAFCFEDVPIELLNKISSFLNAEWHQEFPKNYEFSIMRIINIKLSLN